MVGIFIGPPYFRKGTEEFALENRHKPQFPISDSHTKRRAGSASILKGIILYMMVLMDSYDST